VECGTNGVNHGTSNGNAAYGSCDGIVRQGEYRAVIDIAEAYSDQNSSAPRRQMIERM
jgi:hypothetical protein